ncbi:MAG: hypothetical protein FWC85_02300 [Elusimicrobia bacterium]|nr:hypothetical protein [Elusimicrobiota bacterium]
MFITLTGTNEEKILVRTAAISALTLENTKETSVILNCGKELRVVESINIIHDEIKSLEFGS